MSPPQDPRMQRITAAILTNPNSIYTLLYFVKSCNDCISRYSVVSNIN